MIAPSERFAGWKLPPVKVNAVCISSSPQYCRMEMPVILNVDVLTGSLKVSTSAFKLRSSVKPVSSGGVVSGA